MKIEVSTSDKIPSVFTGNEIKRRKGLYVTTTDISDRIFYSNGIGTITIIHPSYEIIVKLDNKSWDNHKFTLFTGKITLEN